MTLMIMAAGMGSRYGGLKQIDPVGENGEHIIDYSVYDAIKAGFKRVVFIIRPEIEKDFCEKFFNRIKKQVNATYVFQTTPGWRKKPLGTTSAILAAKDIVNEPFCVINADDYYGRDAYVKMAKSLKAIKDDQTMMVAFKLRNTVSDFGTVSRGILSLDKNNNVKDIKEHIVIERNGDCVYLHGGEFEVAESDANVSMNFFGFTPCIFPYLEKIYDEFMSSLDEHPSLECFLPENIGRLIKEKKVTMKVLTTNEKWMGITYKKDKQDVAGKIKTMTDNNVYPRPLWKSDN